MSECIECFSIQDIKKRMEGMFSIRAEVPNEIGNKVGGQTISPPQTSLHKHTHSRIKEKSQLCLNCSQFECRPIFILLGDLYSN